MGKSSFARTIADNVSAAGLGVHVFSLEDSATSYVYRCLSDHSNVELQRIRAMQVTRPEVVSMVRAAQDISRQNWVLDDSAALTATEIGIRVRRHKPRANTKVVIVDYVQLMRSRSARVRNKGDEVAEAAEGLAEIARKENVAVVVLSQLSRQCEGRDDKRPMLSDLRETGVIEQIADTVLFVMRPEQYLDPDSEDQVERNEYARWHNRGITIVAKNKHGPTGQAELAFHAKTATYRELPKNGNGHGYSPSHRDEEYRV